MGPRHQSNKITRWLSMQVTNYTTSQFTCVLSLFYSKFCRLQSHVLSSRAFCRRMDPVNFRRAHQQKGAPRILLQPCKKLLLGLFLLLLSKNILPSRLLRICSTVFRLSRYYCVVSLQSSLISTFLSYPYSSLYKLFGTQ